MDNIDEYTLSRNQAKSPYDVDKLILMAKEVAIMKSQREVNDVFERELEAIRHQIAEFETMGVIDDVLEKAEDKDEKKLDHTVCTPGHGGKTW